VFLNEGFAKPSFEVLLQFNWFNSCAHSQIKD